MSTGDRQTIKINDRRWSVRVVKNVCARRDARRSYNILACLYGNHLFCHIEHINNAVPCDRKKFSNFFLLAFWASQMFWIIFHSRRPRQLHPTLLDIHSGTAFVWSRALVIAYNSGLQFHRSMFSDKREVATLFKGAWTLCLIYLSNGCLEIRKPRDT